MVEEEERRVGWGEIRERGERAEAAADSALEEGLVGLEEALADLEEAVLPEGWAEKAGCSGERGDAEEVVTWVEEVEPRVESKVTEV